MAGQLGPSGVDGKRGIVNRPKAPKPTLIVEMVWERPVLGPLFVSSQAELPDKEPSAADRRSKQGWGE